MNIRHFSIIFVVIILLLSFFSSVVEAKFRDAASRTEECMILTDGRIIEQEDNIGLHKYNIADKTNASNYSNYETWNNLRRNYDKMLDIFGLYETNYSDINTTDSFIIHSTTVLNRYIRFVNPYEYIDTISIWLIRNSENTNITLKVTDYLDGNEITSLLLNDSDLTLSEPTRVNISLFNYSITGMEILQIEGWGTISVAYCNFGEGNEYEWDIEPEISIFDTETGEEFDYLIQFYANGTRTIDGVWIGSDIPPSKVRVCDYQEGTWANLFQFVTFPAKAISSGSSFQCVRIPWLYVSGANYRLAIYEIDSPSTFDVTISAGGTYTLSQLCHPVFIGDYDTINEPDQFIYDDVTIDNVSFKLVYVLTYFPIYSGAKYLFVSSFKYANVIGPCFMITEGDIGSDKIRQFYLNSNETTVYNFSAEPELSVMMISGMSAGVTGFELYGIDSFNDGISNSAIKWFIPIGSSNSTYDHFSMVFPIKISGKKNNSTVLNARINVSYYNAGGTQLDYDIKYIENLSLNYILASWNISTIATSISFAIAKIYFYTNGTNHNMSVSFWLSDPHSFTGYIDDYDQSFMTTKIYSIKPEEKEQILHFIPYSYVRFTAGELIEFNLTGYKHLHVEEFYKMYAEKSYFETFLEICRVVIDFIFYAVGEIAEWIWNQLPEGVKEFLSVLGIFIIEWIKTAWEILALFAMFLYAWYTVVIPIMIDMLVKITGVLVFLVAAIAYGAGTLTVYKFLRGLELLLTDGPKAMVGYYDQFTSRLKTIVGSIGAVVKKGVPRIKHR